MNNEIFAAVVSIAAMAMATAGMMVPTIILLALAIIFVAL